MSRDDRKRGVRLVSNTEFASKTDGAPRLDRAIQARIGDQLRAMYDELVMQPVPDRLVDLLDQLQKDSGTKDR